MHSGMTVFEVLANQRRRRILGVLAFSSADSVPVRDLAAHLASLEHQDPTTRETKRIRTSLRQRHLERLERVNAITVRNDVVGRGPEFSGVYWVLSVALSWENRRNQTASEPP